MADDKLIMFDFDGTLFKTDVVFFRSLEHSLNDLGFPMVDEDKIMPLFTTNYQILIQGIKNLEPRLDKNILIQTLENRRIKDLEKYGELYENTLPTLDKLLKSGYQMSICTNRHDSSVQPAIKYFELDKYFIEIKGNNNDIDKAILVKESLDKFKPNQAWFVGDGGHDQSAAERNNIPFIYAEYGFGNNKITDNTLPIKNISEVLNIVM